MPQNVKLVHGIETVGRMHSHITFRRYDGVEIEVG